MVPIVGLQCVIVVLIMIVAIPYGAISWSAVCDFGISSDFGIFLMVPIVCLQCVIVVFLVSVVSSSRWHELDCSV